MSFGLVLFAICVVLLSVGQLLEKAGMQQVGQINSFSQLTSLDTILRIFTNPYVLGGIALSVIGLFLWLGALSTLRVSYILPLGGGLLYILVGLLAFFILKEEITLTHWIGIGVIIAGCYLINK